MRHQLMHMESPLAKRHLLGHERRIAAHLLKILLEIQERILQHMPPQIPDTAVQLEAFMDEIFTIPKPMSVEQLRLPIIGIPAAVADPASHEQIFPRHEKRIGVRPLRQHGLNLLPQFIGRALVGVNAQDPVMGEQAEGVVAKFSETLKIALIDLVGVFSANAFGPVGAVRVKDHDLVRPAHAFQRLPDLGFLVIGQDVRGQFRHEPP